MNNDATDILEFEVRKVHFKNISLLQKIYNFRILCREEEGFITQKNFPFGWYDEQDATAEHWVISRNEVIIGAARLNIYSDLTDHPYFPAFEKLKNLPLGCQIGYLSRVVVKPNYRKKGISNMLLQSRVQRLNELLVSYAVCDVTGYRVSLFEQKGWSNLGMLDTTKIKWDLNPDHYLMGKKV